MKQAQDDSRTWPGTHNTKDFEISPEPKERKKSASQQRHSKRVRSCLTYLLVAATTAIALVLVIVVLDKGGRNPVLVYFQGVSPSRAEELSRPEAQKGGPAEGHSFVEKSVSSGYHGVPGSEYAFDQMQDSAGQYQSVMELYMNRLFITPLNKMSLTIPISDEVLRSYQVEAIDYSINDDMVLYLSLGHQLKINNETMVLYNESMREIVHFPTFGEEERRDWGAGGDNKTGPGEQSKLRTSEGKRRLQQHEYYNYTSTSEWNHKPEVVNNIIPTYYPRNPYVPPYGNPYYFSPNILVPYVYIY